MSNLPNTLQIYPKIPFAACISAIYKSDLNDAGLNGKKSTEVVRATQHGCSIHQITLKALGTTTTGILRLFIRTQVGLSGEDYSYKFLWKEFPITAVTPSNTVSSFEFEKLLDPPLVLGEGQSLFASVTQQAATSVTDFSLCAFGGFY